MAVQQCASFCNDPHFVYERAVRRIAKYLKSTSTYVDLPDGNIRLTTRGVVYKLNIGEGIYFYVDANFANRRVQSHTHNAESVMMRT